MSARSDESLARLNVRPTSSAVLSVGPSSKGDLMDKNWWMLHDNFAAVMDHALGEGTLDTSEIYDYASEPWHYDHLHAAWRVSVNAEQAEAHRFEARVERAA